MDKDHFYFYWEDEWMDASLYTVFIDPPAKVADFYFRTLLLVWFMIEKDDCNLDSDYLYDVYLTLFDPMKFSHDEIIDLGQETFHQAMEHTQAIREHFWWALEQFEDVWAFDECIQVKWLGETQPNCILVTDDRRLKLEEDLSTFTKDWFDARGSRDVFGRSLR